VSSESSPPDAGGSTPPGAWDPRDPLSSAPADWFRPAQPSGPAQPPVSAGWSYQGQARQPFGAETAEFGQPLVAEPGASGQSPRHLEPPTQPYGPGHYLAGPRPPRRSGWKTLLSTIAVLVVGGLAVVVAVHFMGGRAPGLITAPSPTSTQKPSVSSSGKPTGKPTPTMPSKPIDVLKKNPIYALKVVAKCPAQSVPATAAAFRKQVKSLVECQNKAWQKALAKTAIEFTKPKIQHYTSSSKSPCGTLGTNFPASYCTADQTLYFSKASFTQGRYYRLAVAEFVIHEYSHHIQTLAKIFNNTEAMKERDASISRRIELQAHCMAQYGLTHSDLSFTAADRADLEYQFGYTSDAEGHGSAKAERYWGLRGLNADNVGACNTWTAKAGRVK